MLKKAASHPPHPRRHSTHRPRACQDRLLTRRTRPFPSFVLGARPSSTYRWERAGLVRLGAARVEWRYASSALFACGLALQRSEFWATWGGRV
jgi:hypothetical protein